MSDVANDMSRVRGSCCSIQAIANQFSRDKAHEELERYRAEGPLPTTIALIDALIKQGLTGADILDVGAGVGAIHHALLERGAKSAVHVDISPDYIAVAREESIRVGHAHRVRFVAGDFVEIAPTVSAADVVTLDRVICCYPDMERLVTRTAEKARRLYGSVHPRERWWTHLGIWGMNAMKRLRGSRFRSWLHSPSAIDALLRRLGFARCSTQRTWFWEVVVYRRLLTCVAFLLTLGAAARPVGAQQRSANTPASTLNVYLDCENMGCDFDFFRTEITAINWVRDRQVADVHILVTTQPTGAGGREYTVTFLGLRQFANLTDTLKYVSLPAASDDDVRRGLAKTFRLGLVRYLARTAAAEQLTIGLGEQKKEGAAQTSAKTDPWHYWVFRTSINGWANGEKTYRSFQTWGNVNADRITESWKTQLSVNNSYNQSDYKLNDTTTFTNIQRGYGGSVLQVKSIDQHWSAGLRLGLSSSTYDNFRRALRVLPAIEYDIFPYSQSTRRQLRLEYNIGYADFAYHDTTIFDKLREAMPIQRLLVSIATREPWGSIDVGVTGTGYLNDRSKYRVGSFSELSLKLFRGFNFRAFGAYDIIRDQFGLAKKNFTPEEILTRQFQRGTTYRFFGNVGLSYTFGSIFNNVVNPRMSSGFFD